jgi:hypothetical protein
MTYLTCKLAALIATSAKRRGTSAATRTDTWVVPPGTRRIGRLRDAALGRAAQPVDPLAPVFAPVGSDHPVASQH